MKLRKTISTLLTMFMLMLVFGSSISAYAATEITEVRISYEEINVGDSIADAVSKFTVAASENYTITDVKVYFMDSQSERLESGTFEKDKVYAFVIVITPKNNNYVFPKDKYNDYAGNVYMNEYFNYRNHLDDNTLYVSYDFAAGKKNVKEINLIFDEPVVGKTPATKASYTTVPENAYTGDLYLEWFCSSDGNWEESVLMSETDVFESGKYYSIIWYEKDGELEINDGFYDYNSVVKINGTMIKMNFDYGYMYTPDEVHNLTKTPAKAATCTADGNSAYYTCSTCGKYYSDDSARTEIAKDSWVVKATGHKWDSGKVTKEATTKETGVKTYTCTVCGETKTEVIDKLPETPAKEETKKEEQKQEDTKKDEQKQENTKFVIPDGWFATYEGYYFYKDANGDITCIDANGKPVINGFKCDGTYTYYFQLDGTAMKDRLTYHPDGEHVIYFDSEGHEVFSDFANVKKTIAGEAVDDYCFFNVFGYMYVDVVTYDKTGSVLYYANAYGVMEMGKWFQFSDNVTWADGREGDEFKGGYGYATEDGTLMTNTQTTDWEGRSCYLQGNGVALY